jgi:hypothetical protein
MSESWDFNIEIPLLVCEISSCDFYIKSTLKNSPYLFTDQCKNKKFMINDIDVYSEFKKFWGTLNAYQVSKLKDRDNEFFHDEIKPPFFTRDDRGRKVDVENIAINFHIEKAFYFGSINKQAGSMLLKNAHNGKIQFFIPEGMLTSYKDSLQKITHQEIPQGNNIPVMYTVKTEVGDIVEVEQLIDNTVNLT